MSDMANFANNHYCDAQRTVNFRPRWQEPSSIAVLMTPQGHDRANVGSRGQKIPYST